MAQFDYANIASMADRLLTRFGVELTLTHSVKTPDGAQPWVITDESTTETVRAVAWDYKQSEIDGDNVRQGDRRYLLAALNLTSPPKTDDLLGDGTTTLRVVSVVSVQPGDTGIVYAVQCRK